MSEYIDREDVLKILSEKNAAWDAYQKVQALPAADVRPVVRGRWEPVMAHFTSGRTEQAWEEAYAPEYTCSKCGFELIAYGEKNYCPNCGADMREES